MKVKVVATATNKNHAGYQKFIYSLDKFGWEYDILDKNYVAYGSKMKNAYEYAKKTELYQDVTHLFILDAYDIVVLGTMEEALTLLDTTEGITFNAEKACWPHSEWEKEYPIVNSDWKYLNGGACFVKVDDFINLYEKRPIRDEENDQEVLGRIYLDKREELKMHLDTKCRVFQSVAFEHEGDFEYNYDIKRILNLKNKTTPVIIHGNGKTDMSKVYKLL